MANTKLSIIIPLYNEEENIRILYDNLLQVMQKHHYDYEIIFVDDGSVDKTAEIMEALGNENPKVKNVFFKRNFGQTPAMMSGINMAKGDVLIPMDGDNQNDPNDIPLMLEKLNEGFDVVSGWRKNRQDKKLTRILPSKIANGLISRIGGVKLHDYGCSMKAYRKEILKPVKLYGEMHRFIPIFASWQGAKVTEMVVHHHPRKYGKTKYGLNRTFKVLLDLFFIVYQEKYFKNPIYFFGGFGLFNFLLAGISFLLMLYFKFWGGKSFVQTPLPIFTVLLFLVGILSLFFGLIAEMQMRTYYEVQEKQYYLIQRTQNMD